MELEDEAASTAKNGGRKFGNRVTERPKGVERRQSESEADHLGDFGTGSNGTWDMHQKISH